jgi:hypothetical protein
VAAEINLFFCVVIFFLWLALSMAGNQTRRLR